MERVHTLLKKNSPRTILNTVLNNSDVSVADFRALTMAVNKHGPFCYFKYNGEERTKEDILHQISVYQHSTVLPKIMFGISTSNLIYNHVQTFLSNLKFDINEYGVNLWSYGIEHLGIASPTDAEKKAYPQITSNLPDTQTQTQSHTPEQEKAYNTLFYHMTLMKIHQNEKLNFETQKFDTLHTQLLQYYDTVFTDVSVPANALALAAPGHANALALAAPGHANALTLAAPGNANALTLAAPGPTDKKNKRQLIKKIQNASTILKEYVINPPAIGYLTYHPDTENERSSKLMNKTFEIWENKLNTNPIYKDFAVNSTMAIVFAIILYMASRRHKKNKRMKFAKAVCREHRDPIPLSSNKNAYDTDSKYADWIAHAYPEVHNILLKVKTPLQARIKLTNLAKQNYERDGLSTIRSLTSQYLIRTDGQLRDNLDEIGRAFYYFKKGMVSNTRATLRRIKGYRRTKKKT